MALTRIFWYQFEYGHILMRYVMLMLPWHCHMPVFIWIMSHVCTLFSIYTVKNHSFIRFWKFGVSKNFFSCFLKEINTFIQKGHIKLFKWQYRYLYCYKRFLFQIKAVLLNSLLSKESWKIKCIMVSTKIWSSTTVFNIANTQRFLEQHIRMISEESCDIEDWSNDAEHSALIKEINYIL